MSTKLLQAFRSTPPHWSHKVLSTLATSEEHFGSPKQVQCCTLKLWLWEVLDPDKPSLLPYSFNFFGGKSDSGQGQDWRVDGPTLVGMILCPWS